VLHEKNKTGNGVLTDISISSGQADRGIAACGIDDTVGNDGTHAGKDLFVTVRSHSLEKLLDCSNFGLLGLCDLDKDETEGNKSTLSNKICLIIC